jgi:hypothetical protein
MCKQKHYKYIYKLNQVCLFEKGTGGLVASSGSRASNNWNVIQLLINVHINVKEKRI